MTQLPAAKLPYMACRLAPRRRQTRVVSIGGVRVGGDEPVRVQSMTTTFTHDADATLDQIEALARAGCEIVRVTVPTLKDAKALPGIRAGMRARKLSLPLVADIHFSPKLALLSVEHVDKVRINPGNFTDTKRFVSRSYSEEDYAEELERIEETFTPLVLAAKKRGVAMRIGTNHGSLSDRIMNRYGDTPLGMVESALEFVRICEKHDYRDLVISMKASNTQVMVQAYRLTAARMAAEGMNYPFHLGVTEAGDGDDARIKSASGIGSLLQDGIGDTIRVSLTEDPVAEVPVGFALARRAGPALAGKASGSIGVGGDEEATDPCAFHRRPTRPVLQGPASATIGADHPPRVEMSFGRVSARTVDEQVELLERLAGALDRKLEVAAFDAEDATDLDALAQLRVRLDGTPPGIAVRAARALWTEAGTRTRLLDLADRVEAVGLQPDDVAGLAADVAAREDPSLLLAGAASAPPAALAERITALATLARDAGLDRVVATVRPGTRPVTAWVRALAQALDASGLDLPLRLEADGDLLCSATDLGGLLIDGIGDSVCLSGFDTPERALDLSYRILQGSRRRTTKTEYISCPGCGRTLFELEPITAKIKSLTNHLKGVKIAVMGCVVNGPGEMADADFGYVGWKVGMVNLYVGQECVVRDGPEAEGPARLVHLIKEYGRWTEPAPAEV